MSLTFKHSMEVSLSLGFFLNHGADDQVFPSWFYIAELHCVKISFLMYHKCFKCIPVVTNFDLITGWVWIHFSIAFDLFST